MARFVIQQGQNFNIKFEYHPVLKDAVKNIPGAKWNPGKKYWVVPAANRIAVERFAHAYAFKFAVEEEFGVIPPLPDLTVDISLKMPLYPYQEKGVAYNLMHKRTIIGDKPGLGKTAQSIATLIAAEQRGEAVFPCIVVCPSGLKENWRREWIKWSHKKAMILQDSIKNTFPQYHEAGFADVFITNYESLRKYFIKSMPKKKDAGDELSIKDIVFKDHLVNFFKSIIVDESHKCKNFAAERTKFVRGLAVGKEYRLLCSGTPLISKPADLAPQIGILDQFDKFGGYAFFLERYCSGPRKASNLKELNFMLNKACFYQRLKSEVLTDLPDKVRQKIYCELDNESQVLYNTAVKDFKNFLLEHAAASQGKIDKAMRAEALVKINYLKRITAIGKLQEVFNQVDDLLESGEKVILFANLKDVVKRIKENYPGAVTVTGDDNDKQKQTAVDRFQTDPDTKLIICSITAAGVGLTLTASSIVGFVELPWTPAECEQCEDRAHRIGQKDSVQGMYFLAKKTIDERIYKIIDAKREITSIVTSEENIEENVIDTLINLFNQKD